MDLLSLQNKIKRDPFSYREEFLQQQRHFLAELDVFLLKPNKDYKNFASLISFLSQVAFCYPHDLQKFPTQIANLLEQHGVSLEPELRKTLVNALILLRNRNVITASSLFTLFFKLFRISDKKLREMFYGHIVNDIKKINSKRRDDQVNRALQNFLSAMLQDQVKISARMSMEILIELFNSKVWHDSKTVTLIASGIFNKDTKILARTLSFFLRPLKDNEVDESEQDKSYSSKKREIIRKLGRGATSKVSKRKKKFKKAIATLKNERHSQLNSRIDDTVHYNYPALTLLIDPQGYAEKVYNVLVRYGGRFEVKIQLMSFLSRLISSHQLILLDYYSYITKYLQPYQRHVTSIMAIAAQSCHPLVPPETLEPLVKGIANNFINDRKPSESIVVGLNTIREICMRSPHALDETLLSDLLEYRTSKEKGVSIAAKSLLSIYRIINPAMLPQKYRVEALRNFEAPIYGQTTVKTEIEGMNLLGEFKSGKLDIDLESDTEGDIEGEWVDVSPFASDCEDNNEDWESDSQCNSVTDDNEVSTNQDEVNDNMSSSDGWMYSDDDDDDDDDDDNDNDSDIVNSSYEENNKSGTNSVSNDHDHSGTEKIVSNSKLNSNNKKALVSCGKYIGKTKDSLITEKGEDGDDWILYSDEESKEVGVQNDCVKNYAADHILDDEEWDLLHKLNKARNEGKLESFMKDKKHRVLDRISQLEKMKDHDVMPSDLEAPKKRTKLYRINQKIENKKEREEFNQELSERRILRKKALRTNEALKKNKPFMMVRKSQRVKRKSTASLFDKFKRRSKSVRHNKVMNKSKVSKILKK